MKKIHVVKRGSEWVGETGRNKQVVSRGRTKDVALKRTAGVAKRDPEPVSVDIHKLNGEIQEERTYPRKADPRRSPG